MKIKDNFFVRQLLHIITGALIIFLLALAFDATDFLIMSIICTMGITLVVYIPLAKILGGMAWWLINKMIKNGQGPEPIKIINAQKALVDYISHAREKGMNDLEIRNTLKYQGGWQDDDIKAGFEVLK
ncbi:hypothetical protein HN670_00260 [bacterium]|jgi:hypothetical protein|nr:hypothetical protein [bacterium]